MTLSNAALWTAAQDEIASDQAAPRATIIERTTTALCKRHRLRSDADREDISGRLSKPWDERMSITEPN